MKHTIRWLLWMLLPAVMAFLSSCNTTSDKPDYVLVIHGGAGGINKENISAEKEKLYRIKLDEALKAGSMILQEGGSSLDAVEAAIRVLEDSPLFNAGKGAVFNENGEHEMDASIMDGQTLDAGAVAGVHGIRNPITAARAVMEDSPHVLLTGSGAEQFAIKNGLSIADSSYFFTQGRWDSYQKIKDKHGTVGAVALDREGNLTAGTSTGGMTFKMAGRVGDSPIIGAGTYANNNTCAVSATGHGEYFIRNVIAYDISALMEYRGYSLHEACSTVIREKLKRMGGTGGVIAVDKDGNIDMEFNTSGMFRGFVKAGGEPKVYLYGKE